MSFLRKMKSLFVKKVEVIKEVPVEKTVEVVKETVKEVPVEVVRYVEKPVEIIKTIDNQAVPSDSRRARMFAAWFSQLWEIADEIDEALRPYEKG